VIFDSASEPNSHVHGLETRSGKVGRTEELTAGADCTKLLALPIYTSRISILIFLVIKAIQYSPTGMAIADDGQLARIAEVPKREFMRRGINQHTLEKICNREPVRAIKLAKCLKILDEIVQS
jgi:hypothetical protein